MSSLDDWYDPDSHHYDLTRPRDAEEEREERLAFLLRLRAARARRTAREPQDVKAGTR